MRRRARKSASTSCCESKSFSEGARSRRRAWWGLAATVQRLRLNRPGTGRCRDLLAGDFFLLLVPDVFAAGDEHHLFGDVLGVVADALDRLGEEEQVESVRKLAKQRADSITEFAKAGRTDLVDKETREREILVHAEGAIRIQCQPLPES